MAEQDTQSDLIARIDSLAGTLRMWEQTSGAAATAAPEMAVRLDQDTLDDLYRTNVYAQRIVDGLPEEALRLGFSINYGEVDAEDAESGASDPLGDEMWRIGLREKLQQAAKLARKDGRAAIYVGVDDGQDPSQPVNPGQIRRVTHLTVIERDYCQPLSWQGDFRLPNFGEPETYQIVPFSGGGVTSNATSAVHRSRLLILEGRWISQRLQSDNQNSPDSVLQRSWRSLQDFRRVEADIPKIVRSFSQLILTMPGATSLLQGPNKGAATARILAFATGMNLAGVGLLGEEEKAEYLTRTVTGLAELYDRLAQAVAAAAEMPMTLLFGHSPSGLSTDDASGRKAWYARVGEYRQHALQPQIEQVGEYLALAIDGPCQGIEPETWEVVWPPLDEPTEAEAADIRSKQAVTDRAYWDMGVLSEKEIRLSRFGSGKYSSETQLIEDEEPEAAPPADGGGGPAPDGELGLDAADLTAPEAVRAALRRGLAAHAKGASGAGLEPITVAWARRLAKGERVSPEKASQGARWWGRNERFLDAKPGTPAYTAALLWGGAAGRDWFRSLAAGNDGTGR